MSTPERIVVGSRARTQAPPPHIVCAALLDPHEAADRQWLALLADEVEPTVLAGDPPRRVLWSSLWARRPDALIRFDLEPRGAGTLLRWTVTVAPPAPDDSVTGHLRYRMNQLVNGALRARFGQ